MYEKKGDVLQPERRGPERTAGRVYCALQAVSEGAEINLNKDSYRILSWEPPKTEDGAPTSLSSWLEHLSAADRIVPEDKDEYLAKQISMRSAGGLMKPRLRRQSHITASRMEKRGR